MCKEFQKPRSFGRSLKKCIKQKASPNRVYLKEQFHTLHMNEGTSIFDHLSVLNGIVSELESIGLKMDDDAIALRAHLLSSKFLQTYEVHFDLWEGEICVLSYW